MDGLFRSASMEWPCPWEGKIVMAKPMQLRHFASAEFFCFTEKVNLIDDLIDTQSRMPSIDLSAIIDKAKAEYKYDRKKRSICADELQKWLNSEKGIAYSVSLLLGLDFNETIKKVRQMEEQKKIELARLRNMASGVDELSSFDWPSEADDLHLIRPEKRKKRMEQATKSSPIPWRRVYRFFADNFGWGPDIVSCLTLYQLRIYQAKDEDLGGVVSMDPVQAATYRSQKKAVLEANRAK